MRPSGTSGEQLRCRPEHALLADEHAEAAPSDAGGAAGRAPRRAAQDPAVVEARAPAEAAAEAAAEAGREAAGRAEVEAELRAVLAEHGLQDLEVQRQPGGQWAVAGVAFALRRGDAPGRGQLLASRDGCAWEPLEALVRQHQQRPRGRPLAPAAREEAPGGGAPREEPRAAAPGLPAWRSDGMPSFNDAFPAAFHAAAGSSHYYSQFRVRVPSGSQYEHEQQPPQ